VPTSTNLSRRRWIRANPPSLEEMVRRGTVPDKSDGAGPRLPMSHKQEGWLFNLKWDIKRGRTLTVGAAVYWGGDAQ